MAGSLILYIRFGLGLAIGAGLGFGVGFAVLGAVSDGGQAFEQFFGRAIMAFDDLVLVIYNTPQKLGA